MAIYVLDSNFFIQAHRSTYPLDVAIGFWGKVKQLADEGKIVSIDKVKNELYDKNDDLEAWCKANLPDDFFIDTTTVMSQYGEVTSWAMSRSSHYLPNALNEFLDADEADAFLVAFALAASNDRIIVTHETSQPARKNKVKIPEVCSALGINHVGVIDMFRQLGERF